MSSGHLSRRRLLAIGGGSLSVSVAGCAGVIGSESTSEHGVGADDGEFESTHEYEVLSVRAADDAYFVFPDGDAADTDDDVAASLHSTFFVTTEDDTESLEVETDANDVDDVRAFVRETDFASESIVIVQRRIDDCYRRRLRGVRAGDDSFRTQFCRGLKAPTTACEADKTVMEAFFLRVHRPYDESPSSRSSSERSSCPVVETMSEDDSAIETDTAGPGERGTAAEDP